MRGDVATRHYPGGRSVSCAPRARGCCGATRYRELGADGRPACAGILPAEALTSCLTDGVPRVYGNVARSVCASGSAKWAPAVAGMSRRVASRQSACQAPYSTRAPAVAGMLPATAGRPATRPGAPRVRGDVVADGSGVARLTSGAPRARGCRMLDRRYRIRFPRMRGDVAADCSVAQTRRLPRGRGGVAFRVHALEEVE